MKCFISDLSEKVFFASHGNVQVFEDVGIFLRRDISVNFCNMVNIFTCRCPNRSGVGAIDSPDLFEQVLDQRCIPEVSEKISRTTFR